MVLERSLFGDITIITLKKNIVVTNILPAISYEIHLLGKQIAQRQSLI